MASRHLSRIATLQALFAQDVRESLKLDDVLNAWRKNTDSLAHGDEDASFTKSLIKGVCAKHTELDDVIKKSAPQWPLEKIAIIDRNILRIGLYELLFLSDSVPPKVALNESIELAKTFGGDASGKFINGVLGAVYRDIGSPRYKEAPQERDKPSEDASGVVVCSFEKGEVFVALVLDPFDTWTIPKSRLKEGELSEDTAKRTIKEELGLETVTLHSVVGEHSYTAHDPEKGALKKNVGYFLACSPKVPLVSSKKETVKEVRWVAEEDLTRFSIYEDLRTTIEKGIEMAWELCTK